MLNRDKILHTIFGTAKIDHHGYYIIKSLQSVDLDKLKEKVLAKGLEWREI